MNPSDLAPEDTGDSTIPAESVPTQKRKALSRLKRELTDEELSSPGVQKLLIDTIEKAEDACKELESFRTKYHQVDKELALSNGKLESKKAIELLSGGCLAVGAALIGFAPGVWANQPTAWVLLALGVLLTLVGVVSKVVTL